MKWILNQTNWKSELNFTKRLCLEAGKRLINFSKKKNELDIHDKDSHSVTSSADLAIEKFLTQSILTKYPQHKILAEEDYEKHKDTPMKEYFESEYTWLIDPIDGTNNFLGGFPFYAICVALCHKQEVVVGVVYAPELNQMFYATQGQGAWIQSTGSRAKSLQQFKNHKSVKESLISVGFHPHQNLQNEWDIYHKLAKNTRAVRRLGSAALELCYVAWGKLDGHRESSLYPWDIAAAGLICQEAGVKVTDINGQSFHPLHRSILAFRDPLYDKFVQLLR